MNIRNRAAVASLRWPSILTGISAIASILLSSCIVTHSALTQPPATQMANWESQVPSDASADRLRDEIRSQVQEEVDRAFYRTATILNVFLVILTLFPLGAAVGVWLLLGKLTRQMAMASQEIESLKYDTVSELKTAVAEAQGVLEELKLQVQQDEAETEILFREPRIQEVAPVNYGNYQQFFTASDYAKQGDAFFFENRYEEAINAYNQALQLQPDLADTWNNRGVVLTRMQRYDDAIASYEQATKIRPNYPDAWNNRGVVLLELQQYQDAIACYEQAIQAKPDYADAWNNRGVALSKMQKYEEAVASYNRALQIKNDYTDAWNNRGVALTKLQKYEAAIDSYDQATKIRPDFYRLWYNKARCYALQRKLDLALENLKRALNLNPTLCKELAKIESDFDEIRHQDAFQQLMGG